MVVCNPKGAKAMWEIIDTLNECTVISVHATHRKALNATRKLEPEPTQGKSIWRYLIRKQQGAKAMTRNQALPHVSFCVDSALSERALTDMPASARLVGWQCGFEPLFVAVWSMFDGVALDAVEATDIAIDLLDEKGWFADEITQPDYII